MRIPPNFKLNITTPRLFAFDTTDIAHSNMRSPSRMIARHFLVLKQAGCRQTIIERRATAFARGQLKAGVLKSMPRGVSVSSPRQLYELFLILIATTHAAQPLGASFDAYFTRR